MYSWKKKEGNETTRNSMHHLTNDETTLMEDNDDHCVSFGWNTLVV